MKSIGIKSCILFILIVVMLAAPLTNGLCAQESFPKKEIQVTIAYKPGGSTDLSIRLFAKCWRPLLGTNIMVVSRPGGGGLLAGQYVASSNPDGYNLGFFSGKQSLPEIYAKNVPYTSSALKPLFMIQLAAPIIAVKADSPWKTLKDFVEYAKKNPGLKYATTGRGATPHLVGSKFSEVTGVKLADVPYDSDASAMTALLGGDVKVAFLNTTPVIPQIEAKVLRALAIHGARRMSAIPDVPTFIESGVDMPIGVLTYDAMFAPPGLPDNIAGFLIDTARKAAADAECIKGIENIGSAPYFAAGKDFQAILDQYRSEVGKLVKDLGLFQE